MSEPKLFRVNSHTHQELFCSLFAGSQLDQLCRSLPFFHPGDVPPGFPPSGFVRTRPGIITSGVSPFFPAFVVQLILSYHPLGGGIIKNTLQMLPQYPLRVRKRQNKEDFIFDSLLENAGQLLRVHPQGIHLAFKLNGLRIHRYPVFFRCAGRVNVASAILCLF